MAKMCTVSRLERQFATLYLFHAPTPPPQTGGGVSCVQVCAKIAKFAKSQLGLSLKS